MLLGLDRSKNRQRIWEDIGRWALVGNAPVLVVFGERIHS